jgi:hypothetical protein
METLLDDLFLFDSVPMDLYPTRAEEMYSICFVLSFCIVFCIAETGIARGSPPGTTAEVQRVGFPRAEIRFVSPDPDRRSQESPWRHGAGTNKTCVFPNPQLAPLGLEFALR